MIVIEVWMSEDLDLDVAEGGSEGLPDGGRFEFDLAAGEEVA